MLKSPHGGDIYRNLNVIDFSANINPFGPPAGVTEALKQSAGQIHNYPDIYCSALRESIAQSELVPKENIICGNGAADLIFSLALAKKPQKALLLSPTFFEYEQALLTVDCDIRYFDLKREEAFAVTEKLLEALTEDLDLIYLCNPNNPTGVLIENGLLCRILEKCQSLGIFLVLDECFLEFTDNPKENSLKSKLMLFPNLFILKAFTKLYAMPGLRLGYGLCSDGGLLDKMFQVTQPWNVSIPAQAAGIAALKEEDYVKSSLELICRERKWLLDNIRALGFWTVTPRANYIFFQAQEHLCDYALENGILIRDCSNYRGLAPGDYRIAVKLPEQNRRLIEVMQNFDAKEERKEYPWQNP